MITATKARTMRKQAVDQRNERRLSQLGDRVDNAIFEAISHGESRVCVPDRLFEHLVGKYRILGYEVRKRWPLPGYIVKW